MYPLYRIIGKEGGISTKAVFIGIVVCPLGRLNSAAGEAYSKGFLPD